MRDTVYGALGDDSADDQPAVQKAIDAAGQGGTVYFPPGRYRIAAPLRLSLGVTLRGDWNPHFPVRTNMADSFLRSGIGNFTGEALIVVDPAPVNGDYTDSAHRGGPRLHGLALDGRDQKDATGAAIDGIRINPGVKDFGMDKVTVWRCTGHGLNAQNAAAFQLNQVHCVDNDGHGFTFGDSAGTGGTPAGVAYVSGRIAGTSFTVKGATGDTSTVAWLIVEPA
ncbi:glycosyl hydrolase family 28-related protein [Streptomyces sp. NPDC004270]